MEKRVDLRARRQVLTGEDSRRQKRANECGGVGRRNAGGATTGKVFCATRVDALLSLMSAGDGRFACG
jgi:hypothetical protein